VTNPLTQENQLKGREAVALQESETKNTVAAKEQDSTTIAVTEVVVQANEVERTGFNSDNPGGTIDITA
jgi:hypothetical protein